MIGSGIFRLPASLAPYGLNSVIGWVLSAAGALAVAVVLSDPRLDLRRGVGERRVARLRDV